MASFRAHCDLLARHLELSGSLPEIVKKAEELLGLSTIGTVVQRAAACRELLEEPSTAPEAFIDDVVLPAAKRARINEADCSYRCFF